MSERTFKPTTILLAVVIASMACPAFCQEYNAEDPDNSYQTDITNGTAEQNGMYAIRNGKPSPYSSHRYLQGYASNQHKPLSGQVQNQGYTAGNPGYGMQDSSIVNQGYVMESAYPMQAQIQMQGPMQAMVPMQGPLQGQVQDQGPMQAMVPMQGPLQGQVQDQMPMQGQVQEQSLTQIITQTTGFKVTGMQVVGAAGAALMFNYMTQGGGQNVMNSMGARGWGGRRHTLGSGGMVFH